MGLRTAWGKLSNTVRYSVYGALFGLMFPVFATLGDLAMRGLPLTLGNLVQVQRGSALHWVIDTAPLFLGLFASFAGRRQDQLVVLNQALSRQVRDRDQTIDDLNALQDSLDLRSRYLAAITEVARSMSLAWDDTTCQAFVSRVVALVSERLGFYHVGVFCLDDAGEWAVLRAASSEGGQRMLAQGYRLRAGRAGLVSSVLAGTQPRIVPDLRADIAFSASPELPDTLAEMAFPLRVGDETIGALDVQSTEPGAFGEHTECVAVVQVLADLIAVALGGARLHQQVQESLLEMRQAYREMDQDVWREMLRTRSLMERYDPAGLLPPDGQLGEQARRAVQDAEMVLGDADAKATLAAPIRVRGGQVIGVLDARKPDGAGAWTPQERELVQALVEQLGVALDGAQLYQDSQERAERERVIGEISSRMRESLSIDAILQTAIREIGETLAIDEVEVRMKGEMDSGGGLRRDDNGEAS